MSRKAVSRESLDVDDLMDRATPLTHQIAPEVQPYGWLVPMPIALSKSICTEAVTNLNQLLADTIVLRDLYRKHHWQVIGPLFNGLHALFEKHYKELDAVVDAIAERVQMLGGVCLATPQDVADTTIIPRAPRGREAVPGQVSRLLYAHEIVLKEARTMARLATGRDDVGTADLITASVIRLNEQQAWFVAAHAVDTPEVKV